MAFGENQLSPGLISLSLLASCHPIIFQHYPVRTSTWCYPTFILHMARSPGFGSTLSDYRPIQTRFPFGSLISVNLATKSNSLTHYTKGTQSVISVNTYNLPLLVRIWFQVLFHSPYRGSFRLSLTVLVHYRSVRSI